MRRVVVDASVVVKWVLPTKEDEADTEKALSLLKSVRKGRLSLYQPPHWLAEVAAVIVRLHQKRGLTPFSLPASSQVASPGSTTSISPTLTV